MPAFDRKCFVIQINPCFNRRQFGANEKDDYMVFTHRFKNNEKKISF